MALAWDRRRRFAQAQRPRVLTSRLGTTALRLGIVVAWLAVLGALLFWFSGLPV